MASVTINGKLVIRTSTHAGARSIADSLYQALTDIILFGSTEDTVAAETIYQYAPDGDATIAVNGRDWESFIAPEDRISNLIALNQ